MLRITTKDSPQVLTFRLEGRLGGSWVRELKQCWQDTLNSPNQPTVRIDLTGVTYIDTAGKSLLAEMHERGAQFVAQDCVTKAVVAEIVGQSTTVDSATRGDSA